MPKPVDDDTSRKLPYGPEHAPLWFPEADTPEHIELGKDDRIEKDLRKERERSGAVVLPGEDPSRR